MDCRAKRLGNVTELLMGMPSHPQVGVGRLERAEHGLGGHAVEFAGWLVREEQAGLFAIAVAIATPRRAVPPPSERSSGVSPADHEG
jgi:hypothetical protein